jgi:TPR repeat protein
VEAQCILGALFYHGYSVQQYYHKAMEWYKKAMRQGDNNAWKLMSRLDRDKKHSVALNRRKIMF